MVKLLYIGKSNKRFTHNKIYGWYGLSNEENLWINIKTNNSTLVMFNNNYDMRYFVLTECGNPSNVNYTGLYHSNTYSLNERVYLTGNINTIFTVTDITTTLPTVGENIFVVKYVPVLYGCPTPPTSDSNIPVVYTSQPSNITSNSVDVGGTVLSNGNSITTNRGICYATVISGTPPEAGTIVSDGLTGTGIISLTLSGLASGTSYKLKAYAYNYYGCAYGSEYIITTL